MPRSVVKTNPRASLGPGASRRTTIPARNPITTGSGLIGHHRAAVPVEGLNAGRGAAPMVLATIGGATREGKDRARRAFRDCGYDQRFEGVLAGGPVAPRARQPA